jgi:hypothetical protein
MADQKGVKYIVGDRVAEGVRPPMNVKLMTISDLLSGR